MRVAPLVPCPLDKGVAGSYRYLMSQIARTAIPGLLHEIARWGGARRDALIILAIFAPTLLWPNGSQAQEPKLLKVLTNTNSVNDVLPDGNVVWFGTHGGVKCLDRERNEWGSYTRFDGLATNYVAQLAKEGDELFAFHRRGSNRYSVLKRGEKRWREIVIDESLPKRYYGEGHGRLLSDFVVFPDCIWCAYTEVFGGTRTWPVRIELRQYARPRLGLLCTIEVFELKDRERPPRPFGRGVVGLVRDGHFLWCGLVNALLKVDTRTGNVDRFPLPREAVIHYPRLKETRINRIHSLACDEESVWLRLTRGLARFHKATGQWRLLFQEKKNPLGGPMGPMLSRGDSLWLSCGRGLIRYEKKTGRIRRYDADTKYRLYPLAASRNEVWTNFARLRLPEGKWRPIKQHPYVSFSDPEMFFREKQLFVWGDGGEKGGVLGIYDLTTDELRNHDTGRPLLLVPAGEIIWFITDQGISGLSLRTGNWTPQVALPLEGRKDSRWQLAARRGDRYWLYGQTWVKEATNPYREHFVAFNSSTGRIEQVVTIPESLRRHNADPGPVSERHLYLITSNGLWRYRLRDKTWHQVPLPLRHRIRSGCAAYAFGRLWCKTPYRLVCLEETPGGGVREAPCPYLRNVWKIEKISQKLLEVTSLEHVFRYDGKRWSCAPRVPRPAFVKYARAVDRNGNPTDLFAVIKADSDVTIWRGTPAWHVDPAKFTPFDVDPKGFILPRPKIQR